MIETPGKDMGKINGESLFDTLAKNLPPAKRPLSPPNSATLTLKCYMLAIYRGNKA